MMRHPAMLVAGALLVTSLLHRDVRGQVPAQAGPAPWPGGGAVFEPAQKFVARKSGEHRP